MFHKMPHKQTEEDQERELIRLFRQEQEARAARMAELEHDRLESLKK